MTSSAKPQTGTGKTAAFGLPLQRNLDPDSQETQAIVLTPTRVLRIEVGQALRVDPDTSTSRALSPSSAEHSSGPSSRGCGAAPTSSSPRSAG